MNIGNAARLKQPTCLDRQRADHNTVVRPFSLYLRPPATPARQRPPAAQSLTTLCFPPVQPLKIDDRAGGKPHRNQAHHCRLAYPSLSQMLNRIPAPENMARLRNFEGGTLTAMFLAKSSSGAAAGMICLFCPPGVAACMLMLFYPPGLLACIFVPISTDSVSERLGRWTRHPLGSARRGWNPLAVDIVTMLGMRCHAHQRCPPHRMRGRDGPWIPT